LSAIEAKEDVAHVTGLTRRLGTDEHAQGMAEYALLAGLVALVALAAITLLGTNIQSTLNNLATTISGS
jgi:pilus assembly protein Flp/PilA